LPDLQVVLKAYGYRIDYKPAGHKERVLTMSGSGLMLAKGSVDTDLDVRGGKAQPAASGFLRLSQGELAASALPQVFRDIAVGLMTPHG
jgi:hypothetical protein